MHQPGLLQYSSICCHLQYRSLLASFGDDLILIPLKLNCETRLSCCSGETLPRQSGGTNIQGINCIFEYEGGIIDVQFTFQLSGEALTN